MISYNIKFPLNDDPTNNGLFSMSRITKDAFSSNLLLLLLTQKGERYYEPDYGTDLIKYLFEPNDGLTESDVEQEIKKTISLYIPQLKISSINFIRDYDEQGFPIPETQILVNVKFLYSEDAFNEEGSIDILF